MQIDQINPPRDTDSNILAQAPLAIHKALNPRASVDDKNPSALAALVQIVRTAVSPKLPEAERVSTKQRFITHLGALVWDALIKTEASNLQITHSEFTRERNPEKKLAASINILASTLLHNVVKKHIDLKLKDT